MAYENLISTKVPVTAPALLTAITEAATTGTAGVDFQAVLSARWEDGSFQEDIPGQTLLPGNLPVSGTVAAPEVLEKAQSVPLSAVQDFFSYAQSLGYNPPDEILEGIDDVLPTASTTTTRGIPLTEDVFLTASADTIEGFSRPDSTDESDPSVAPDLPVLPSTDAQALVAMMLGTAMQPVYAAATGGVANPAVETLQSGPMMTASAPIATVSVAEADFAQVISTAEGQSRPAPMAAGLITGETANPVEKPVSMDQPESSFNQAIDAAMDARAGTPDHSVLAEAGNTRLTPIPLPERQAVASTPAQDWLVQSRVGDPVWSDELGGQITVMLDKTLQNAEIRLNPEHLGPLQVTIRMENDQLAIQFSSEHAVVREALEVASSRLRDMLTSQQLNPTEISVSPPEPRQDTGHAFGGFDRQSRSAYNDSAHEPSGSGRTVIGADDQETVTVTQVSTPSDRSISFYA